MKNIKSFILGAVTTVLASTLVVSALAASGTINISVNPDISIKVNGETFKPKDASGKDVMVFEYQGTTYAPLRALAESYGLEVGWDGDAKMATVGDKSLSGEIQEQEGAKPQEKVDLTGHVFKAFDGAFSIIGHTNGSDSTWIVSCSGDGSVDEKNDWWFSLQESYIVEQLEKMAEEMLLIYPRQKAYELYLIGEPTKYHNGEPVGTRFANFSAKNGLPNTYKYKLYSL